MLIVISRLEWSARAAFLRLKRRRIAKPAGVLIQFPAA